eukprot:gene11234-18266_t
MWLLPTRRRCMRCVPKHRRWSAFAALRVDGSLLATWGENSGGGGYPQALRGA